MGATCARRISPPENAEGKKSEIKLLTSGSPSTSPTARILCTFSGGTGFWLHATIPFSEMYCSHAPSPGVAAARRSCCSRSARYPCGSSAAGAAATCVAKRGACASTLTMFCLSSSVICGWSRMSCSARHTSACVGGGVRAADADEDEGEDDVPPPAEDDDADARGPPPALPATGGPPAAAADRDPARSATAVGARDRMPNGDITAGGRGAAPADGKVGRRVGSRAMGRNGGCGVSP